MTLNPIRWLCYLLSFITAPARLRFHVPAALAIGLIGALYLTTPIWLILLGVI